MTKKKWGYALLGLGVFRLYVESSSGSTSSLAQSSLVSYLDYGGGPGTSTISYVILVAGAYLVWKG